MIRVFIESSQQHQEYEILWSLNLGAEKIFGMPIDLVDVVALDFDG